MVSAWIVSTVAVSVLFMACDRVACDPCVSPGDNLSGSSGFFSSPNFPSNFPLNKNCTWNITVPAGRIIKVTFLTFTLNPSQLTDCTGGAGLPSVLITNVASDDGEQEFKICGTELPYPVYSVGNSIQVTLQSGGTGYSGFNASYEAIDKELLCPGGLNLTKTSGVITSPFFPRKYPDNQNCSWQITARQGNRLKLEIDLRFNIQDCGVDCTCDYLQIKNGFSADPSENERMCGVSSSKNFYSTHQNLEVLFVSDGTKSKLYDGFKATYTQLNYTPPICPTEAIPLTGYGTLSSPNYPMSNYPASRNCSWIITVPSDKLVKLAFTELALGSCESSCSSDNCTYVELYDGSSAKSRSLGRFCSGSVLRDVFSSGNQMFVRFLSGSSLDRGFEAQYSVSSGRVTTTTPSPSTSTSPTATTKTSKPTTRGPYGIDSNDVKSHKAVLRLADKEFLSNGNRTRYTQIIVIHRKDKNQDIGFSTEEKYKVGKIDKDYENKEKGKPYITAEFDYSKRETFSIGDEEKYSKTGSKEEYFNGELESNSYYAAFQRSFDGYGSYDSEKFVLFKTEKFFPVVTVVVVVVVVIIVVLFLVALAVYFFYVKKRGKPEIDPGCGSDEKEMKPANEESKPIKELDTSF